MPRDIGQGDGRLRTVPGRNRESGEQSLANTVLYLSAVKRITVSICARLGAAFAFGLYFQSHPCLRCDDVDTALIGHRSALDCPAITPKVVA